MTPPILPALKKAAGFALVAALAFFAADLTATLAEERLQIQPRPIEVQIPHVPEVPPPAVAPPTGLGELLALSAPEEIAISSQPGVPAQPGQPTAATAQTPPPPMTLKGTMAGQGLSLAMIEMNGETKLVGVGETLAGFTVVAVGPYSAELRRGSQSTVLQMSSPNTTTAAAAPVPVQAQAQPQPAVAEPVLAANTAPPSQAELRQLIDSGKFSGTVRLKPVKRENEIVGMEVKIKDASHPLYRLGIRNGDIVTSLNDSPLNGAEALSNAYRVIRNTPNLSFQVERGGRVIPVNVTLAP